MRATERLADVPLFFGLQPGELQLISRYTQRRRFQANRTILHRGDPGTSLFIILSGKGLKKENVAEGVRITNAFQLKQTDEYFERLAKCGLPERRERSRLWKMVEMRKQTMPA